MSIPRPDLKTAGYALAAVFLLALDRALKAWVYLDQDSVRGICGELFRLRFALNPHIAFSLPLPGPFLPAIVALVMLLVLFASAKAYLARQRDLAGLLLIVFSAAMSNFFDRLRYGAVIDYFDLEHFTVFNLADAAIVGATAAVFFLTAFRRS